MIVYTKGGTANAPALGKIGVYFFQIEGNGPINIGATQDLEKQFVSLQRANPYSLVVVGFVAFNEPQAAAQHDHGLRERFAQHHIHSDWYRPVSEIVEYAYSTRQIPVAPTKYRAVMTHEAEPKLLTPQQLAEKLGVSVPTIRRLIQQDVIPYLKAGAQIRFDLNAVLKAMAATKRRG
jgi:excisionase family DNA binding protein